MEAPLAAPRGVVHLVGAGPGDAGLLTVRAREMLEAADAIVRGPGVPRSLLPSGTRSRVGAEVYYTGRRGDRPALSQPDVHRLVIGLARQGKRVVHLVRGDPFGAPGGSAEAQALHDAAVPFEIVPGVDSATAGAAYAGIPVAAGALAPAVTLVSGGAAASRVDWSAVARTGATLVLHDAPGALPAIAAGFAAAGVPLDIPAAAIERATRHGQRTVTATLATVADAIARAGMSGRVTIVIGWAVLLRDELAWLDQRPLFGQRIAVAGIGAAALTDRLRAFGATVARIPEPAVSRLDLAPLRDAIARIVSFEWIVFASAAAVMLFWEQLLVAGLDARALSGRILAAVGPETAAALLDRGVTVDVVQPGFGREALAEVLAERTDVAGSAVLYVTDDADAGPVAARLFEAGARVTVLPVFRAMPALRGYAGLRRALAEGRVALVVLTSPEAVRDYARWADPEATWRVQVAVPDRRTADAARALGADVVIDGSTHADEDSPVAVGLAESIAELLGSPGGATEPGGAA